MSDKDANIKKMANLLREGATMLSEICPDDKVPIFKLKTGEMICPVCNRKVILVKSSEEERKVERDQAKSATATELESTIMVKITDLNAKMVKSEDAEEIEKLSKTLASLYEALNKIRSSKG
jgi:UPF0148 protein